jgi:PPOX class probable F420-dependent enzyme
MPQLGPEEARRRFADARVARMATMRRDGRPHLVPIVFATDGDRVVAVVDAKPKVSARLQRLRNIAGNPLVSLLADHYSEDWDAIWWVRADGAALVVDSGPERERALDLLAAKYSQYADATRNEFGPAIVVAVERWVGWAAARQ